MENTGSASCPFCEWYYGSAVWRRSCAQNILWAILAWPLPATILTAQRLPHLRYQTGRRRKRLTLPQILIPIKIKQKEV